MSEVTSNTTAAPAADTSAEPSVAPEATTVAPEATAPAPNDAPTTLAVDAKDGPKGTFSYEPTGDSKLDMTLSFLGKHGFGPGHPAMVAAVNGDFSILRAQLAEKNVPGADAYLALGEAAYQSMHAENEQRRAADKAAVEGIVGGAEQWASIQSWAAENASEQERGPLRELLNKGGQHALIAAGFLASQYEKATGGARDTVGSGAPVSETRGTSAYTTDALSPKDYAEAVHAARSAHKGRDAFEDSPEYHKLRERRLRYKG